MGAHTVGRLTSDNSGYQGVWLSGRGSTTFDNAFYAIMVNQSVTYTAKVLQLSLFSFDVYIFQVLFYHNRIGEEARVMPPDLNTSAH